MRLLFVTSLGYLPHSHGGAQSSTNELCICLKQRGHQVAVLAAVSPPGVPGWKSRIKTEINKRLTDRALGWKSRIKKQLNKRLPGWTVSHDSVLEYGVWRAWFPWEAINFVVDKERPDLIVVIVAGEPMRMAISALRTQIPILLRLHDVEFHQHAGRFADLSNIPCVANSHFTACEYRTHFGANPGMIYPLILADKYRTKTTRENVTFVNPHPDKGLDIALGIARLCPEIPFTFVESWLLSEEQRQQLMLKSAVLPNITILPRQSDMRAVYGKCKILLAPSVWEEAYGRVASEAQLSGIPVVASSRGGLPEAVGPGGILLHPQHLNSDWAAAVRKLWYDQRQYDELSAAAIAHAERREMTLAYQMDAWERAMLTASGHASQAWAAYRSLGS
jgi:glycosyltransferase involved in cell wall biosynthesis